jgi:vitamin B12/bleomycin/antimicrobial peptide transport system ATP-binding/permease protein
MLSIVRQLKNGYGRYFGLAKRPLKHTLALAGIVTVNIILAFLITVVNSTFNNFLGVLDATNISYTIFFGAAIEFLGAIIVYGAIASFNLALSRWLGDTLANEKIRELNTRWNTKDIPFLYKFLPASAKLNPAQVIEQHSRETAQLSVTLLNSFLMTSFNAIVGLLGLWRLSTTLTLIILGSPLAIPGYMALASFLYSFAYNITMGCIGKQLHTHEALLKASQGEANRQLHHTDVFAEPIAIRRGAHFEESRLTQLLDSQATKYQSFFLVNTALDFIRSVHQRLAFAMGLLLSAPEIIARRISTAQLFEVSEYFSFVVALFTWPQNNYEAVTQISVAAERLQKFEDLLQQCESLSAGKAYQVQYDPSASHAVFINNMAVKTPTGKTCTNLSELTIPAQARVKITGESGLGKTTFLRMLANIWPFGEGDIRFAAKAEEIICLSQEPCFPQRSTLLEAILYPNQSSHMIDRPQLASWMQTLGLDKHLEQLEVHREWAKVLSGGEKQRIALLSILVNAPKIAILDESLSALDENMASIALDLMQAALPNTTFICVDHAANQTFYTHILSLQPELPPTLIILNTAQPAHQMRH